MIEIKRGNVVVWSGKAQGKQYKTIMQEDRVVITLSSALAIDFRIGDTVVVYGDTYKLNKPEDISRDNTKLGFTYQIEFEALYYDLGKWYLYGLDRNNQLTEGEVFLMGNASSVLDLLVRNANRVSSGWTLGVVDETEVQQYAYANTKLLTVLQDVADKNQLEFWVDGRTINLTRRQPLTGLTFSYGKGNGLYKIQRQGISGTNFNTLKIEGGNRNIPNTYGFRYLQPTGSNPIVLPHTGDVVEENIQFANIYPRLIAGVTSVPATENYNAIRSTDIDFDINNHLLNTGESVKVAFTSGQLAGFIFSVNSNGYNHADREIVLNRITDDPAYPAGVPNTVMRPQIGDKFVLLDISMPTEYVTNAEARLKEIGDNYIAEYSRERFTWSVSPTPKYILENNITFELGGLVRLIAEGMEFDDNIRIGAYVRDIAEAHLYDVTLTDVIRINEIVRQQNQADRYNYSVSKGLSVTGEATNETLASVTARGKVTPFDITTYGVYNTDVLGIPVAQPKPEDNRDGFATLWFGEGTGGEVPLNTLVNLSDVVITNPQNDQVLTYDSVLQKWVNKNGGSGGGGGGYVTSVGLTAPNGFIVENSPITSSGDLSLKFANGYSLPTIANQANWDTAFANTHSPDTLQSVCDRNYATNTPIKANGIQLIYVDGGSYSGVKREGITTEYWNTITSNPNAVMHRFTGSAGNGLLDIYNNGNIEGFNTITFPKIVATESFRLPTVAPLNPQDGNIWID